jgi:hypothetical protein
MLNKLEPKATSLTTIQLFMDVSHAYMEYTH